MTDLRDKIARAVYENRVALIESDAERQYWPAWDEHEEADADEWRGMADAVLAVLDDVRAEAWQEGWAYRADRAHLKHGESVPAPDHINPYRKAEQ